MRACFVVGRIRDEDSGPVRQLGRSALDGQPFTDRWERIRALRRVPGVGSAATETVRAAVLTSDEVGPEPFDAFYRAHVDRVYRALTLTVGDAALGREATDEAMARAYANWARVRTLENPAAWVYRVGFNWAVSWRPVTRRLPQRGHRPLPGRRPRRERGPQPRRRRRRSPPTGLALRSLVQLSALGGAGGAVLGIAVTGLYANTQDWPAVVPAWASAGGLAATLVIGGFAGLYPAVRAARLAPTEALATP
jgi:hypothetical protein